MTYEYPRTVSVMVVFTKLVEPVLLTLRQKVPGALVVDATTDFTAVLHDTPPSCPRYTLFVTEMFGTKYNGTSPLKYKRGCPVCVSHPLLRTLVLVKSSGSTNTPKLTSC
jgi:hypothetical protein